MNEHLFSLTIVSTRRCVRCLELTHIDGLARHNLLHDIHHITIELSRLRLLSGVLSPCLIEQYFYRTVFSFRLESMTCTNVA